MAGLAVMIRGASGRSWSETFVAATVEQVVVDWAVTLVIGSDGPAMTIRIESPFVVVAAGGSEALVLPEEPSSIALARSRLAPT